MYYVYFIQGQETRNIKIGYTNSVKRRLAHLKLGSPDALTVLHSVQFDSEEKVKSFERYLHKRFHKDRVHGEWFKETNELLNYIEWTKDKTPDEILKENLLWVYEKFKGGFDVLFKTRTNRDGEKMLEDYLNGVSLKYISEKYNEPLANTYRKLNTVK